jgi:hypothetical protein
MVRRQIPREWLGSALESPEQRVPQPSGKESPPPVSLRPLGVPPHAVLDVVIDDEIQLLGGKAVMLRQDAINLVDN